MRTMSLKCIKMWQKISTKVLILLSIACKTNDGLYVKLGQGMAAMDHLLPPPYYKHISKLQDKARAV